MGSILRENYFATFFVYLKSTALYADGDSNSRPVTPLAEMIPLDAAAILQLLIFDFFHAIMLSKHE
jgi:hypothetical protein